MGWRLGGLVILSLVLTGGNMPGAVAVFAGLLLVSYWGSLHLHPFRACRACKGTGRHHAAFFPWSHRLCGKCGGQSRHRRWGVQALKNGQGQQARAEKAAQKARGRRGAPR